ncbi:pteridine reductase [Legionella impletisoli]|uniref:Pteridine reductase n=1 Tax=Legionella impletisoli TaxID=343510 RepID=A0A917NCD7_9GAMM|nr:pteridine reductase [Legionella impletisoli]GGI86920.1 pteridine reductase [Legionella impletisoli]
MQKKQDHTLVKPHIQAPVALITGAARRIGAATAEYLHKQGFRVLIHYLQSKKEAESLSKRLNDTRNNSAKIVSGDLLVKETAKRLIQEAMDWAGRLDALVNNASLFKPTDFSKPNEGDWEALFVANVRAPFWLSLEAYPYLSETKGCIINITDIHSDKPLKGYAVYCQTKAALNMQTKALAREFAPLVRVNAVAPGAIVWPEEDNTLTPDLKAKIINATPLKQHGDPIYIAQAVCSLIDNPFITGEILRVDGGRSIV